MSVSAGRDGLCSRQPWSSVRCRCRTLSFTAAITVSSDLIVCMSKKCRARSRQRPRQANRGWSTITTGGKTTPSPVVRPSWSRVASPRSSPATSRAVTVIRRARTSSRYASAASTGSRSAGTGSSVGSVVRRRAIAPGEPSSSCVTATPTPRSLPIRVAASTAVATAVLAATRIGNDLGVGVAVTHDDDGSPGAIALRLTTDPTELPVPADLLPVLAAEAYRLEVRARRITVTALDVAGLLRGLATLDQLGRTTGDGVVFPPVVIVDQPRFAWRGLCLDLARHFFDMQTIKSLLTVMAAVKLNVLHLHLTDDQGWRLQSPSRPALTDLSGATAVGGGPGGFLTVGDYTDLIAYAAARGITIVPEIDIPGHVNAALHAYGDLTASGTPTPAYTGVGVGFSRLDPELPATAPFIAAVLGDLAAVTPGRYLHIGCDEALTMHPAEYDHLIGVAAGTVRAAGKTVVGWQEIGRSPLPARCPPPPRSGGRTRQGAWSGPRHPPALPAHRRWRGPDHAPCRVRPPDRGGGGHRAGSGQDGGRLAGDRPVAAAAGVRRAVLGRARGRRPCRCGRRGRRPGAALPGQSVVPRHAVRRRDAGRAGLGRSHHAPGLLRLGACGPAARWRRPGDRPGGRHLDGDRAHTPRAVHPAATAPRGRGRGGVVRTGAPGLGALRPPDAPPHAPVGRRRRAVVPGREAVHPVGEVLPAPALRCGPRHLGHGREAR